MDERMIKLTAGALLHDIGKVVFRAGESSERHAISGRDFLRDGAGLQDREILDCVRFHHAADMAGGKLEGSALAYVVYMADNMAAAADRREGGESEKMAFDKGVPLAPVFNLLRGNCGGMYYSPQHTNVEEHINYPQETEQKFESSYYKRALDRVRDNLKGVEWTEAYLDSLLEVLEANLSFVPSSTNKKEIPDVSLFDHMKLTAAFAAAIELYMREAGEKDYAEKLYRRGKAFYSEKAFLLTVLDISGIQKFIYTITSEHALKNLRARSFYLDMLTEHVSTLLLARAGLPRANLLYVGGGRCTLLLPNTADMQDKLAAFLADVNGWFLQNFEIALYLAGCGVPCSSEDLCNHTEGRYADIYREISTGLSDSKAHRYGAEAILALNSRGLEDDTRECSVCRRAGHINGEGRCEICAALEKFSGHVLYDEFFIAGRKDKDGSLPLPGGFWLAGGDKADVLKSQAEDGEARIYGKNRFYTGKGLASKLWIGDYHTGETFEELAEASTGIKRLGVLRADVDDLGQAFASGFARPGGINYQTLSRSATLSRQLSLFFKLHIRKLLENPAYTLSGKSKEQRRAAIVYSGGDDLFIAGAWDDVLELAIDVRRALARFSEGTLSLSAGIGFYPAKFPISVMAEETADLEEASKGCPGKNAVTLPGNETYPWQVFEEKVLGEKYSAVRDFFDKSEDRGKNFLYNLLELIRGRQRKINLARYIYLLSRLEPGQSSPTEARENYKRFASRMLAWVQKDEDVKELQTAMQLYVYITREREGNHENNR